MNGLGRLLICISLRQGSGFPVITYHLSQLPLSGVPGQSDG